MGASSIRRAATLAAAAALSSAVRAGPAQDGNFRAMVDRPLFSPTRRPPPASDADVLPSLTPPDPPSNPEVALSGVIAGGGGGVALVRRARDAGPISVALGGHVDGWTVTEIRPRAVVLRRQDRSVTIELPTPPH